MSETEGAIFVAVTGDLVLDEPDAGYWLSGIAPALREADITIGHLEVPHTASNVEVGGDVPAPGASPENLAALPAAGFDVVTLAGNHIGDCGAEGIADTIGTLDSHGIRHSGAGSSLAAARAAAVATAEGRRVAVLSYNCVGPEEGWAGPRKAGCAYLPITTVDGSPVSPTAPLEGVSPVAADILREDLRSARDEADFVIVALHKGIVHTPAKLAPYEREVAQLAVDCGADAIISHHAHIVRGIEFHNGRPIFHGLGNGCVVTSALSPDQDHPARKEWAERRKKLFGFEPDPAYRLAPFHPEAVNAFIGRIEFRTGELPRISIVPVFVEAPGRPVLADATQGRAIYDYVERITRDAGLPAIRIDDEGRVEPLS